MNEKELADVVNAVIRKMADVSDMTLDMALALSEAVRKKASEIGVKAVVAVSNRGGNPVLVQCMDDSYIASYDIALNKAYTSVALKMSTCRLSELAKPGSSLYGIQFTNQGKIVIFGGGEPLCDKKGEIVGGLGVSGGNEAQDAALAAFGKEYFENL
jgi:uncharacterized protein GlcG (DUF336 family)